MTDRDAFLAAVVANPDDTTARLVFADWLDETGNEQDAAHAELIRVQCELSSLEIPYNPWCPVCGWEFSLCNDKDHRGRWPKSADSLVNLGRRQMQLLTANIELSRPLAEMFLGENPRPLVQYGHSGCYDPTVMEKAIGWEWRNGFIETTRMPIAMFVGIDPNGRCGCPKCSGVAAALVSRCPIRRVEFTDREPMLRDHPNEWAWCSQDGRQLVGRFQLPKALWDHLDGGYVWGDAFRVYASGQIAHAALSRAAIAYARKRAGLPEWATANNNEG